MNHLLLVSFLVITVSTVHATVKTEEEVLAQSAVAKVWHDNIDKINVSEKAKEGLRHMFDSAVAHNKSHKQVSDDFEKFFASVTEEEAKIIVESFHTDEASYMEELEKAKKEIARR